MTIQAMATEVFLAAAVPNTAASSPQLMDGNNNLANTPPATGGISVPNDPSGASLTAVNWTNSYQYMHTISATARYLQSLNVLGL